MYPVDNTFWTKLLRAALSRGSGFVRWHSFDLFDTALGSDTSVG